MSGTIWDVNAVPERVKPTKSAARRASVVEHPAAIESGNLRRYQVDFFPKVNIPKFHEIWNYEGDPVPLPGKWAKLAYRSYPDKFESEDDAKEYFKTTWLADEDWDPANFFFVTHRSETVGTVMVWPDKDAEDEGWIRMLATCKSPKYQDGQLERSLISLAAQRLMDLGRGVVNVRVPDDDAANWMFDIFRASQLPTKYVATNKDVDGNAPTACESGEYELPDLLLDPIHMSTWSADITKFQHYTRNDWRDLCDPPLYHESWTHAEQDTKILPESFAECIRKSLPEEMINAEIWKGFGDVVKHPALVKTRWMGHPSYDTNSGFFITFEEAVIGTVIVFDDPHDETVGWIRAWCVCPKNRGTGCGKALLGMAVRRLVAMGKTVAKMWVPDGVERHDLLRKYNFAIEEENLDRKFPIRGPR